MTNERTAQLAAEVLVCLLVEHDGSALRADVLREIARSRNDLLAAIRLLVDSGSLTVTRGKANAAILTVSPLTAPVAS